MRLSLALLALACALGCQTAKDPLGHRDALKDAQKRYTNFIRWRDAERAAVFVVPARRAKFLELAGNLEAMEISDYELGEIEYGPGDKTADVDVTYHGYSLSHLIERKIRVTQKWARDENGQWRIDPELERVIAKLRGDAP